MSPSLDLDLDNDSGSTGLNYATAFIEDTAPVPIADDDVTITDPDSTNIVSATLAFVTFDAGDLLFVNGTLPSGITASVYDSVP
jgi:large repetitive protein